MSRSLGALPGSISHCTRNPDISASCTEPSACSAGPSRVSSGTPSSPAASPLRPCRRLAAISSRTLGECSAWTAASIVASQSHRLAA